MQSASLVVRHVYVVLLPLLVIAFSATAEAQHTRYITADLFERRLDHLLENGHQALQDLQRKGVISNDITLPEVGEIDEQDEREITTALDTAVKTLLGRKIAANEDIYLLVDLWYLASRLVVLRGHIPAHSLINPAFFGSIHGSVFLDEEKRRRYIGLVFFTGYSEEEREALSAPDDTRQWIALDSLRSRTREFALYIHKSLRAAKKRGSPLASVMELSLQPGVWDNVRINAAGGLANSGTDPNDVSRFSEKIRGHLEDATMPFEFTEEQHQWDPGLSVEFPNHPRPTWRNDKHFADYYVPVGPNYGSYQDNYVRRITKGRRGPTVKNLHYDFQEWVDLRDDVEEKDDWSYFRLDYPWNKVATLLEQLHAMGDEMRGQLTSSSATTAGELIDLITATAQIHAVLRLLKEENFIYEQDLEKQLGEKK